MTQFVILTKIDVDRNSGGKGKPQRKGCYQLYWRASLLVIQKLWVINSRILQQRDVEKKGWRDGNLYRMKTRTKWFDILYTQNQLVLLAYFTDCSSLGIQFAPFPLFFWIANRCYFSSYRKDFSCLIFFPFFLFWRLVISHEQSWLLDNMKRVSILYRPAVDLFGLELNWWPGLFTICVASSSKVNDWGVLLIHVLRRISQLYVTAQPLESYNVFIILAAVLSNLLISKNTYWKLSSVVISKLVNVG